jgi:hypothetical protein
VNAAVLVSLMLSAAPIASSQRVAVLKTEVSGDLDAAIGQQVTAKIAETIRERTSAEVISSDEIVSLLKHEKERAILGGCSDKEQESCLAELANALGADLIASARLSRLPGESGGLLLAVSVVDARTAGVLARVSESWGGESILLLSLVRPVIDKLLAAPDVPTGSVEILGAAEGSRIIVDDVVRGTAPAGQMAGIAIGAHRIAIQKEGMRSVEKWIVVEKDAPTQVPVQQEVDDPPFYATWWFWTATGAGVAVTGAAIVAVALATTSQDGPTGVNVNVNADQALGGAR